MDLSELIAKLEAATEGSRELDAEVVAVLNNAVVKPYPPTDDYGPKYRWQFWSSDYAHFLGNERQFPVPRYTTLLDAALQLVPEGMAWGLECREGRLGYTAWANPRLQFSESSTPALALCIAALKARQSCA